MVTTTRRLRARPVGMLLLALLGLVTFTGCPIFFVRGGGGRRMDEPQGEAKPGPEAATQPAQATEHVPASE